MEYYSSHINKLIESFPIFRESERKSAQRLAFHIMNMPEDQVEQLASSQCWMPERMSVLQECCTLTDRECVRSAATDKRDHQTIMVVENTRDLAAYEKTGKYDGVYHVLHGAISRCLESVRMISS